MYNYSHKYHLDFDANYRYIIQQFYSVLHKAVAMYHPSKSKKDFYEFKCGFTDNLESCSACIEQASGRITSVSLLHHQINKLKLKTNNPNLMSFSSRKDEAKLQNNLTIFFTQWYVFREKILQHSPITLPQLIFLCSFKLENNIILLENLCWPVHLCSVGSTYT